MRRGEEVRQLPSAEGMAEHPEGARRIAEATRRLSRGEPLHEVSPQGFVLACRGVAGSAKNCREGLLVHIVI